MICRDSNTIAQQEACQPPWHAICSPPPPPPPPPGGGGGGGALARPVPTYPPTLSIRRQRIGSRRLRHRRRQALRHRRRLGRCPPCCPRCRCTHRRTPRARRWRNWRLRSAGQSLNSCVKSRLETFRTQEKNAKKEKKICKKKLDTANRA